MEELQTLFGESNAQRLSRTPLYTVKEKTSFVPPHEESTPSDNVDDSGAPDQDPFTAPVERAPIRQVHKITAMVALVVDSVNLDMPGQQSIQPIDLISMEDVFSEEELARLEELPKLESDEYVVPTLERECGVPALSDEHARGRSPTAHQGHQRAHSLLRHPDFTAHGSQRRDQSAPPRLHNKALYERIVIPTSKAIKDEDIKDLRAFADVLLSEDRYNQGESKTHMLVYGVDEHVTAKEIIREALLFQHRRKVNYLTQNKVKFIRDHLRYHKKIIVTKKTVTRILFRGQRAVSAGRLPYTKIDIEDDESRVEREDKKIFARKPKEGQEKWLSQEEKKAQRQEAVLKARKAFKPRNAHSVDAHQEFKQNTDTMVRLHIDPHPNTKRVARLEITVNYIDDSQPGVQPFHQATINLTDRNLRPRPLVTVPGLPDAEYEPHHTITDVTHESWSPRLHKLFNVGKNKTYFRDLQKATWAGQRMLLIAARHNDMPWCNNLLIDDHPSDTHKSLGTAIDNSPRIYILVRSQADTIEDMMKSLVQAFAAQVTYDPVTDLYVNPAEQMTVSSKNIKPLADRPKFTATAEYTFESFQDYKNRAGIGALIEHNWKENKMTHTAKAAFVPIRETWDKNLKLHMAYAVTATLDEDSLNKAALTKGDKVHVTIEPDNPATPAAVWRGNVVPRLNITGMAEITIILQRPRNRDGTTDDDRSDFCNTSPRVIDESTISQLKYLIKDAKRVAIKIACPSELKEMKLHMDALNRLSIGQKLLEKDAVKYNALNEHQHFFMCDAPKRLSKKGLYDDIDQADRHDDYVRNHLLDYQVTWIDKLINGGMLDATALLAGSSGSGKTTAIAQAAMSFVGNVRVPNEEVIRKNDEITAFFNRSLDNTDEGAKENDIDSGAAGQSNTVGPGWDKPSTGDVTSWGPETSGDENTAQDNWNSGPTAAPTLKAEDTWNSDPTAAAPASNAEDNVATGSSENTVLVNETSPSPNDTSSPPPNDNSSPPPNDTAHENENELVSSGKPQTPENGTPCFALPSKNSDYTLERGRITVVAAQNETVEELYDLYTSKAVAYCEAVGLPMPLVVRKHARSTELNAVRAMLHFMFEQGVDLPFLVNPEIIPQPGTNTAKLYDAYLKSKQGSEYREIRDARFKHLESSEAYRVIQLMKDDDDQPDDIKECFTDDERDMIREQLRPLRDAEIDLINNGGEWTDEIEQKIKPAAKIGLDWVEQKASIIVTSASHGLEPRFVMIRRPHAIVIEEMTRMSDAVLWGYWSKYWDVLVRLASGDWRQLGPQLFGKDIDNPFHAQVKVPLLGRAYTTGFPVHQFMVTHRFGNDELLQICQLVNKLPNLAMSSIAERRAETQEIKNIHQTLYQNPSACMFVHVKNSNPQKDPNGSYYNVRTAIVTLHLICRLAEAMPGACLTVLSPYNAQTNLHQYLCDNAIRMAKEQSNQALADQLSMITFSTIDSYMGKENKYVVVDTLAYAGHLMEDPRTIVAFTRASLGLTVIGDAEVHSSSTDNRKNTHPLKQLTRHLCKSKRFFEMTESRQRYVFQYTDALQAIGMIAGEKIVDLRSIPIAVPISAIDDVFDSDDESDDDDDVIFRSRFAHSNTLSGSTPSKANVWQNDTFGVAQPETAPPEAIISATDQFDIDIEHESRQRSPLVHQDDPRLYDVQYNQAAHILHRAFHGNHGHQESLLEVLSDEQMFTTEIIQLKELAAENDVDINYLTSIYDACGRSVIDTRTAVRLLHLQYEVARSATIPYEVLLKYCENDQVYARIFDKIDEDGYKISEDNQLEYNESDVSSVVFRDIKQWLDMKDKQPHPKDANDTSHYLDNFNDDNVNEDSADEDSADEINEDSKSLENWNDLKGDGTGNWD